MDGRTRAIAAGLIAIGLAAAYRLGTQAGGPRPARPDPPRADPPPAAGLSPKGREMVDRARRWMAEQAEQDEEHRRRWAAEVLAFFHARYPDPLDSGLEYVRLVESAPTGPGDSWAFLAEIRPPGGTTARRPIREGVRVVRGRLDPGAIDERRYLWLAADPARVAAWYVANDGNDPPEPMDLVEVVPELGEGNMHAYFRGRASARRYRLDVTGYDDSRLVEVAPAR